MSIVDLFFPKICVGCGQEGSYICEECQKKLIVPEKICPMCCKPSLDGWVHPRCKKTNGIDRLIVGLPYRGMVQDCLKKVKYKSAWEIINFLYELAVLISCDFRVLHSDFVVTPVPMWDKKERDRGFNQAELVAMQINKGPTFVYLERTRQTMPMFGLSKNERKINIEGAFGLTNKYINKLSGKRVILVDDVWTTGATMRECAKVLKERGAKEVWGVALAR